MRARKNGEGFETQSLSVEMDKEWVGKWGLSIEGLGEKAMVQKRWWCEYEMYPASGEEVVVGGPCMKSEYQ